MPLILHSTRLGKFLFTFQLFHVKKPERPKRSDGHDKIPIPGMIDYMNRRYSHHGNNYEISTRL
ncbi:hypothetical protein DOT_4777 [Desulfosporosinus sp. OT]|nr:hypothetical protein DOT_4777 [Desulfosporosinus sp. OT]